jgi:hypothetical protein
MVCLNLYTVLIFQEAIDLFRLVCGSGLRMFERVHETDRVQRQQQRPP